MTDLTGQTGLPRSTTIAPNGDKFTKIVFFDFNALYLWAQSQEFPTTPGYFCLISLKVLNFSTSRSYEIIFRNPLDASFKG